MTAADLHRATSLGILAAWIVFAAIFLFRKRPPSSSEKARDPLGLVGLVLQGLGFGAVWNLRRPDGVPLVAAPFPVVLALSVLAVVLAAGSVALTLWAVRTLGRQWSLAARLVEGHELVTSGPYRRIRNPIYTGMLGLLLGTGLAWSTAFGLVLGTAVFVAGTVIRIRAEQRLLRDAFGDAWTRWSEHTAALVPGIW